MRRSVFLSAALSGLVLAACGGTTDPSSASIESTTFAASLNVNLAVMTRTATGLYYRDLTAGTGTLATAGKTARVHYQGWLPNGSSFDKNLAPTTPFSFVLGSGQVVPGFDEGITGMKVGGVRQIIMPPALGYGSRASAGIPANSILVFTVELVTVQ
ncbi:MAG: fbp [Gemmatimonadetes bacterium]|nr:fbp [Gemmatimonadota bacterium]